MTALADRIDASLLPPRRPRRPKRLFAALAVVVLAFAALLGNSAVRMRAAVDRERDSLANARTVEAAAERALAGVRDDTAAADTTRTATLATDAARNAERSKAHALLIKIEQEIATIHQKLTQTQAAQNQVALYSAPRHTCVTGVRTATTALQHGDFTRAIAALTKADAACSISLAAVTGARFPYDFPDPSVIEVDSVYYAYSTNSGAGNIQVLVSRDLEKWTLIGDALAALPAWASPGATWAPAVITLGATFRAYYTTREMATGRQCISVAVALAPIGPFVDGSKAPLMCQAGGSIDPSPFVDEAGVAWLHWKSEGTATRKPTIWAKALSADGLTLTGEAVPLLTPGQSWERGVVEGPSMIRIAGHDYLFYSGGFWTTAGYAQGVASCDGPAGPCRRILSGPVLASAGRIGGPGGGAAFTTPTGAAWLAFHAFTQPDIGYPNSRTLHLASVRIVNGVPVLTPE
jgi:Glycosyl hydrolases family 43